MEKIEEISEQQAEREIDKLFETLITSLKEEFRPDREIQELQALLNANLMTLNFSLANILNRVRSISLRLWNHLRARLSSYWTTLLQLITLQPIVSKLQEWSISFTASASPSATITLTFKP